MPTMEEYAKQSGAERLKRLEHTPDEIAAALAAFRKRREESLALLRALKPEQATRGGIHATRGRMTIDDFVTLMAWHDDNHLDRLTRALEGRA